MMTYLRFPVHWRGKDREALIAREKSPYINGFGGPIELSGYCTGTTRQRPLAS